MPRKPLNIEFFIKKGKEVQNKLRLRIGEAVYREMKRKASAEAAKARTKKLDDRRKEYLKSKEDFLY